MSDVKQWTCDGVYQWMVENNFSEYAELFRTKHKIDGEALLSIEEYDLRQPPLQIPILGDIKHLSRCINKLKEQTLGQRLSPDRDYTDYGSNCRLRSPSRLHRPHRSLSTQRQDSNTTLGSVSDDEYMDEEIEKYISKKGKFTQNRDPEIFKTILSFIYVFAVFLLTAFIMVVVHDRVPDMQKYPPLPDIFLDNMPYIPWGFQVCEWIGSFLYIVWCFILFFHRYRFILMRRMFSMLGTIFLLRCVTMLITSLSVPGHHLQCQNKLYDSWYAKLSRTYEIWTGFGMSIQGVQSCGDYMFSGHTACITLLNFFITEYTPHRMYYIHTTTWVFNLFGIFFILAAHEHYSIDVFIAFYITSRLFLYYHTLANNRSLMLRDKQKRQLWFPLFSYFESKCDGIVPNEYEWPFRYPKSFVAYFERRRKRHHRDGDKSRH